MDGPSVGFSSVIVPSYIVTMVGMYTYVGTLFGILLCLIILLYFWTTFVCGVFGL